VRRLRTRHLARANCVADDALDQSSTRRPVLPDSQENHHGRCRCGRPHRPRGSPRRARDPGRQRPRRALGSRGRRRPGPVFAERAGAASPPRARPPRHRGRAQERLRGAARHRRNRGMPSGASPADVRARLERFLSSSARAIRRWRRRRDVKDRPLGRCGGAPGTTEGRRSRTRRWSSRVHACTRDSTDALPLRVPLSRPPAARASPAPPRSLADVAPSLFSATSFSAG